MTYHEQRRQAEELLRRNYTVSQIAKELGLQTRTVQRWAKLLREPKQEETESKSDVVEVEVIAPASPTVAVIQENQNNQSEQWCRQLEKSNVTNRAIHNRFKKVILTALDALEKSGVDTILENGRLLQILSLGVTRHIDGETKTLLDGREDQLTETQAFKLLESKGYEVIDPSAIKPVQVVE